RGKQPLPLCVNAHVWGGGGPAAARARSAAEAELREIFAILKRPRALAPAPLAGPAQPRAPVGNFTRPAYERLVEGAKEYIRAGDIIQVVPSQRFTRPFRKTPLDLYRDGRVNSWEGTT